MNKWLAPVRKYAHEDPAEPIACPRCRKLYPRTNFEKKLMLIDERLTWSEHRPAKKPTATDHELHGVALAAVNAEIGILAQPEAVETIDLTVDENPTPARLGKWYPFENKSVASIVGRIIAEANDLSEHSWRIWKLLIDRAKVAEAEASGSNKTDDNNSIKDKAVPNRQALGQLSLNSYVSRSPKPPGKNKLEREHGSICVQKATPALESLQDFYQALDKITAYSDMWNIFIESAAVRKSNLGRTPSCSGCWIKSLA